MNTDDHFVLGTIIRQHGYKGDVVAKLDTDQPEKYESMESVLLEDQGGLVPFFIDHAQLLKSNLLLLRFEGVEHADEAGKLIGRELWLPLSMLPPLSGKSFYFHEIQGFSVVDHTREIGQVGDVIDRPGQPVIVVIQGDDKILIPAVDAFIVSIDRVGRILYLQLPEGLVDLYRSE